MLGAIQSPQYNKGMGNITKHEQQSRQEMRRYLEIAMRIGETVVNSANPISWHDNARCSGVDTELFYSDSKANIEAAKSFCRECPVRLECLGYALAAPDDHGVWGGYTAKERHWSAKPATKKAS